MWTRRRRSTKLTNPKNAQWRRHACSAELVTTLLLESIRHELSDSHYDMEHNKQSKFYLIWNQHFLTLGNSILFYKSRSSRWLIELLIDWLIDWFRTNLCSSFFTLLPLVPHIRLKWKFTGEWEWGFGHTIHTITLVSAMLCSLMHKEIEIGTKNIFRCLNLRYLSVFVLHMLWCNYLCSISGRQNVFWSEQIYVPPSFRPTNNIYTEPYLLLVWFI